jgi:hypothetical protein
MRRVGLGVTAALVALAATGAAQHPAAAPDIAAATPETPAAPWAVGERLEYGVRWGFFNVGRASLEVVGIDTVRGEPCWHVLFMFNGRALSYTLRDSLQSWFGVRDMVSRRFTQDNNENGRPHSRHYEIYPEHQLWVRNDVDSGRTAPDPLDEASFFFYARTRPLEPGQTVVLNRYFQHDRNPVTLQVLARQTISVPAGRYPAVAVRPIFQSGGLFGKGGKALIWFSDDESRIPLRIRTSLPIGTLDMSLRTRN